MVPARLACRHLEPVRVEAIGDDQEAGGVPEQAARLVVDERSEATGPCAAGSLEPQLGAAERVGISGDPRTEVDQRSAAFAEREDLGSRTAAAPAPSRAEAA